MGKAGGIISIIAGVFSLIAAFITLFAGGIGSALQADQAEKVIGFGWIGVFVSFLVVIFGATASSYPRFSGIAIVLSSSIGIAFSGVPVAICMSLSTIGGILAIFGNRKSTAWGKLGLFTTSVLIFASVMGLSSEKTQTQDPVKVIESSPVVEKTAIDQCVEKLISEFRESDFAKEREAETGLEAPISSDMLNEWEADCKNPNH